MLARVGGFRPQETVFEIGKRGPGAEAAEVMRKRREKVELRGKKSDASVTKDQPAESSLKILACQELTAPRGLS